ncbi:cation diffusion facilitator family transporter [Niameybacter massiliensis]|uniref:Cation diffusion facilitator family transporter n=1 Tax=Holtiella tumoricola TaxID=3018743 RepID=A0AA42DL02_9FIRM|nr:cation diffusion facilitator family transporter [Holtiella tumoricola]MDA3730750.1 cation diffusion facilitator family transporter [Holtiella tumoricola]
MTTFLIRLFVKNPEDIKNPFVRERYGLLGSWVGICCNLVLFLSKLLIGLISASVSIMADAVNNLSDAASSIVTLVGFKISAKPADEDHPFGHARVEYIAGLVVSFIIIFLGIQLGLSSINKIFTPEPMSVSLVTIIVLILSILMKLWMSFFNRNLGNRINSSTLKATATDSLNDVIATSGVLISVIIYFFTSWNLDGYIGVVVAGFIIYSGINVIRETVSPLLGEAPTLELVDEIQNKLLSYEGVLGIHDLMVHNYGPNRCFASVHAEVSATENILVSHDLIDTIERDFALELGIHLVIHLDPIIQDDELTNTLHSLVINCIHEIDPLLSIHDFRAVQGVTHTNLIFDIAVPHNFVSSDKELAYLVNQAVKNYDESFHCVITVDRSYLSTTINTTK